MRPSPPMNTDIYTCVNQKLKTGPQLFYSTLIKAHTVLLCVRHRAATTLKITYRYCNCSNRDALVLLI